MRINEILGFARTSGKKFTVKKRPPEKFDEPVALKIKNRRADAAKGKDDAWKNKVSK